MRAAKKLVFGFVTFVTLATNLQLNAKECGIRSQVPNVGIYYGTEALENEFPWQISLRSNGEHSCGGAIISDNWIITAAHCVSEDGGYLDPVDQFTVLIGSLDNTPSNLAKEMRLLSVKRVVTHPQYEDRHIKAYDPNDIALIELSESIGLNRTGDNINAICLGRPEDVTTERNVIITGWGQTESEPYPKILRKATVQVESMENCKSTTRIPDTVWEGQVCTTSRPDTCHGDSGGPLQYSNEKGQWFLMGITSWGPMDCGSGKEPGVYTRVSYYLDFIKNVTEIESL